MSIEARFQEIQSQIRALAPDRAVMMVAVTKYASVYQMQEAYAAGIRDFGENKVQDALAKMEAFPVADYPKLNWHLIGSLQTNKVKKTVGRFATIHSVDSLRLAELIAEANESVDLCQRVLLQVNLGEDLTRNGFTPDQIPDVLGQLAGRNGITLGGLMTMAPPDASLAGDREALQKVFGGLAALRNEWSNASGIALPELSMGMSQDFPHALTSGATIIRIGNYLFKN
jgi:pyridoxal phosphate enzyme (YggS family)